MNAEFIFLAIVAAVAIASYWVAEDVYLEYQDKQLKAPGGFFGLYILTNIILLSIGCIAWGIGWVLAKLVAG